MEKIMGTENRACPTGIRHLKKSTLDFEFLEASVKLVVCLCWSWKAEERPNNSIKFNNKISAGDAVRSVPKRETWGTHQSKLESELKFDEDPKK